MIFSTCRESDKEKFFQNLRQENRKRDQNNQYPGTRPKRHGVALNLITEVGLLDQSQRKRGLVLERLYCIEKDLKTGDEALFTDIVETFRCIQDKTQNIDARSQVLLHESDAASNKVPTNEKNQKLMKIAEQQDSDSRSSLKALQSELQSLTSDVYYLETLSQRQQNQQ